MITPSPTCSTDASRAPTSSHTNRFFTAAAAAILVALCAAASSLQAQRPAPKIPTPETTPTAKKLLIAPVQTIAPKLTTFTPVDSIFFNPSAQSFTIALVHTRTGRPTEYRVSRFSDFRDASWRPYLARPEITVPRSWFAPQASANQSVTLFFQLRAKNPRGGFIKSANPVTTEPRFFFSDVKAARILIIYFG